MKWIKCSDRMPTDTGRYFAKMEDGTNFIMLLVNGKRGDYRTAYEWLDEAPSPPEAAQGKEVDVYQIAKKEATLRHATGSPEYYEFIKVFTIGFNFKSQL